MDPNLSHILKSPNLTPLPVFLFLCGTPSKPFSRDFPGHPVVKTPCFHCRGHGFDPWLGIMILHAACSAAPQKTHKPFFITKVSSPYNLPILLFILSCRLKKIFLFSPFQG